MADLIVLGFLSKEAAEEVFELSLSLQQQELVDLEDAALARRDDKGRLRIQQALPTTSAGAASGAAGGALWGTLLGLLTLNPLAGFAVGTAAGAAAGAVGGKLTDLGIDDDLIRQIGEQLQPGKAALFALVRRSTSDKVTEALKHYSPKVLYTNLSRDREEELVKALQAS